ncbi:hypothetical protein ILYODFUR_036054 [Ilyodon furcidens]|uniref:Uncharacterized protein n=1 Tax=Ilyodon furcidens TaxID=33524 RepID=A0ABV0SSS6_9TELE
MLSRREKCGSKRCTSNRNNCSLEMIVRQNPFKKLGELLQGVGRGCSQRIKSHYPQMDHIHGLQASYLHGLRKYIHRLLLSGTKSYFKTKLKFVLHLESQWLREELRGTEATLLESQCDVSTVSDGEPCHLLVVINCVS